MFGLKKVTNSSTQELILRVSNNAWELLEGKAHETFNTRKIKFQVNFQPNNELRNEMVTLHAK